MQQVADRSRSSPGVTAVAMECTNAHELQSNQTTVQARAWLAPTGKSPDLPLDRSGGIYEIPNRGAGGAPANVGPALRACAAVEASTVMPERRSMH